MPTLHFSGTVDARGIDYQIGTRSVLAEVRGAWPDDGAELRVFQDGSEVCRGEAVVSCGRGAGQQITSLPIFEVGDYDVLNILEDGDGFEVDLVVTDDPQYGE